jgi:uncharacterized RDD family membrane protein YckC
MNWYEPRESDGLLTDGVLPRRCLAWLVDLAVIAVLILGLCVVVWMLGVATLGAGLTLLGFLPFVPFTYHLVSLLGRNSATPGQHMLGLTVRRDADLGPPTALSALISVTIYHLTLLTGGLLFLVCLFIPRRRTPHDLLSGLVVVQVEALEALTRAPPYWNMVSAPPTPPP